MYVYICYVLSLEHNNRNLQRSIKNKAHVYCCTTITTSRPKCFYVRTIRTYVQYTAFTGINPTFRIYRFILFHAANKYTYIYMNTYFFVRCVHVELANVLKFYLNRYGCLKNNVIKCNNKLL